MAKARKLIGEISRTEADKVEPLVERLNGLEELLMIVWDKELSTKITYEISTLKEQCNTWWGEMASKYGWQELQAEEWELDSTTLSVWSLS